MFKKSKNIKGLSLIEALAVLAILAGVISVIALRAQEAGLKQKISKMVGEIITVQSELYNIFSRDDTSSLDTDLAEQLGIKPSGVTSISGTGWRHGFDGYYNIASPEVDDNYSYELHISHIPAGEACVEILSSGSKGSWNYAKVVDEGDADGTYATLSDAVRPSNIDASYLAQECNPGDDYVDIIFGFNDSEQPS